MQRSTEQGQKEREQATPMRIRNQGSVTGSVHVQGFLGYMGTYEDRRI